MSDPDFDKMPETALGWIDAGKGAALATVIRTWGSAPRPVGSQLAISSEAELAGSVSGGCVESAVVAEALEALEDGQCRILTYGVSDDEAFAVGLACGGEIRILVEPIGRGQGPSRDLVADLAARRAKRESCVYAVNLDSWERHVLAADDLKFGQAQADAVTADRSGPLAEDESWFLGIHAAPLRMAVVGAVHIAQPLMRMAALAGYDTILIDPREAFATPARFPDQRLTHDWPDRALADFGLDRRTAVVTLTHDPKIDDPAIISALGSGVFYLGSLGSKKTHAKRVARLTEAGFTDADIARIHAPVGADIGARSPAEIAISIMAQITERLRRPERGPGR
ncbi:XdhC family protein [Oceanomicrobium pacificus]|uniref:XdhC/CoxI family protein n=1 Tax=Oceanomicrobium pacificus TaxID=2692916 RepID=A0A6B0TQA7_9RHOB|nr:XdhC/CoxI family protein [Oceanomicrobium pacificus]MXU66126.1 XdhC/CoxI family protein [Oceanomicrobium pacificus]